VCQVDRYRFRSSSLPFWISPPGSEAFPRHSASTTYAASIYPLLTFCPLPEALHGYHRPSLTGFLCTAGLLGTGSLRLSLPTTLTGNRSLRLQGLPRPVGSAFRVFVYPLSDFLLQNPLSRFSDSSVPGVHSFRVFLPSTIGASLETPCSPVLCSATCGHRFLGLVARLQSVGLQSFAPVEEPCSPGLLLHNLREPLLSWSFHL